jgi:hypothetical protein
MDASLIAWTAVILGMIVFEQGNLAQRFSVSPAAADAARRTTETGGLLTILSVPWVVIAVLFID